MKRALCFVLSLALIIIMLPATTFKIYAAPAVEWQNGSWNVTFKYTDDTAASVYVAGDFNSWSTNSDDWKMVKNSSGEWELTKSINSGVYGYKLVVDGKWKYDPTNKTYYPNSDNSKLVVPGYMQSPVISGDSVTFNFPVEQIAGYATSVKLKGSFNGWAEEEMKYSNDGSHYTITIEGLSAGTYEYGINVYTEDGPSYGTFYKDYYNMEAVSLGGNSIFTIQAATTLKDGNDLIESKKPTEQLTGVYGQKLSDIAFDDTEWTWTDENTALSVGEQRYPAYFNTSQYENKYDFSVVEGYDSDRHRVEVNLTVNVAKADTKLTITTDNINKEYDGNAVGNPDVSKTGSMKDVIFTWFKANKGGWEPLDEAPVNTGSYKVVASVAEDSNYNGAETEKAFEIRKAVPSYILPTDLTIKQGEALSSIELPADFKWNDDTQTADVLGTQTFKATFTPTDTADYQTIEVDITIEVVPVLSTINRIPTISADDKTLTVGDKFNALTGVTASDNEDGNITNKIEVIDNTVDTSKAGTYKVTYKVTDKDGASATKTIVVTVKKNSTPTDPEEPTTPGTPTDPVDGNIVKNTSIGVNAPKSDFAMTLDELIGSVLTDEEQEIAKGGVEIKIILTVLDAGETVSDGDMAAAEAAIKELDGYKLGQYLDVSLIKEIGDESQILSRTYRPVRITFEVPKELRGDGRNYALVRVHNGETAVLKDMDTAPDTVTVETDLFSTYAIVFYDESGEAPKPPVATGVKSFAAVLFALGAGALLMLVFIYFTTGRNGLSEEKKRRIYTGLIAWGKKGKKLRSYIALALIFLILGYYYSIGRKTTEDCRTI